MVFKTAYRALEKIYKSFGIKEMCDLFFGDFIDILLGKTLKLKSLAEQYAKMRAGWHNWVKKHIGGIDDGGEDKLPGSDKPVLGGGSHKPIDILPPITGGNKPIDILPGGHKPSDIIRPEDSNRSEESLISSTVGGITGALGSVTGGLKLSR
ncbi:hypothetical protein AV955_gp114 [Diadromus pulchellus ascovirus 4a]|uniref:Complete DpAV4 genome n=1 Tax=Diadromus pulchellus ascovirus 4a TaxID=158683 RepID=F2NZ43_9VIRU|nr:hypothetical protein AV955_gp114 [Diadromus pulchellus ascovirus 4a]CCA61471.1 unnamed protein product [Diadromus pulchellus ascovirus 4a]